MKAVGRVVGRNPIDVSTEPLMMIEANSGHVALDQHLAFVIDDDTGVHTFVAATLAEHGIKAESFQTAKTALAAFDRVHPAIIFLDVALLQSDAIDVLAGLGKLNYRGIVHLFSGSRLALLEAVQRLGARNGVTLGPHLRKPIAREAIVEIVAAMGLRGPPIQPSPTGPAEPAR